MPYTADISALNPDHFWTMDGVLTDSAGALTLTNSGFSLTGAQICEDTTNSLQSNGVADRLSVATAATLDGALDRKAVAGWVSISQIQAPPKNLYREGTTGNQFNMVVWAGNNLMFEVVSGGNATQAFSDNVLRNNRAYHLFARFEGTGFGDKIELYVDGVLQSTTEPASGQPGLASLGARTAANWGEPASSGEVGGESVGLNAIVNGLHSMWATWSGANAQLTSAQIREELFEKGALPGVTISSDTQVNMQAALDAFASTIRPDEPLNIRVEAVLGGGDFTLTADNITHNARASIHVQYMGVDTLSWVNENGSNASIGSTPNGGTLTFIEAVPLLVRAVTAAGGAPVANARVRIEASAGGPAAVGTVLLEGLTNGSGELSGSLLFSSNQPLSGKVRNALSSPFYKPATFGGTVTASGFSVTTFLILDE